VLSSSIGSYEAAQLTQLHGVSFWLVIASYDGMIWLYSEPIVALPTLISIASQEECRSYSAGLETADHNKTDAPDYKTSG
jgi:hypothetical protein